MSTGYLDRHPRHSKTFVGAIALHAGLLALVLTIKPSLITPPITKPTHFILISPERKPPLPTRPRPQPQPQPRQSANPITRFDPRPPVLIPSIVPTRPIDGGPPVNPFLSSSPQPPSDPVPATIDSPRPVAPDPVLTGPASDPRYARDLQPPYPPAMERMEQEGSATVRVQIGTDGRVIDVELVRADNDDFFIATKAWALRKWHFRPATRDGVPVVAWLTKTVRFQITR